ncbi:MAG: 3'-5' exonuclease [Clostridia bacterium]|nr:3'-5' exonuclease [Clostridia bacterium]MDY6184389.1 3'-5' exonuclease [Eubacteriales bacterium]
MPTLNERYLTAKQQLFRKVYGARLNPPQCDAVFQTEGPLLVLAGAGSGKTTVLVRRIAYILRYGNAYHAPVPERGVTEEEVSALETALALMPPEQIRDEILPCFIESPCPPWAILAITFTNKAANEMKERLNTELGDPDISSQITAGTFHSVCVRFLRRFADRIGFDPSFTIYDTDDKKRVIVALMKEMGISDKTLPPKTVCEAISRAKDRLEGPESVGDAKNPCAQEIRRLFVAYQEKLRACNAMDFDDLIALTVELLETCPEALEYYQNKYRYVLVDEYQDTNPAQFRLTELLSGKYRNIMVVGDDDQSIYRFRGATIENILSFDRVYPDCHVVKLEQNYRSTKCILAAANAIISHNSERHAKKLWCDAAEGEKIHFIKTQDQNDEAKTIVDTITAQMVKKQRQYKDFAVLYRINEASRALEGAFAKSGIPYRILGGQRFYDRKEIRDMVAYLYVIMNPTDNLRLKRIINEPKRGIGDTSIETVELIAANEGKSMYEIMEHAAEYPALGRVAAKLTAFTSLMTEIREEQLTPSDLLDALFSRSGYRAMLKEAGEVERPRLDAVEEFITAAKEYEARAEREEEEPTLAGFMEEVALVSDVDQYDRDANSVVLMTMHSAKGLEFPVVFLPGMEENIFPAGQSAYSPSELSEERRLAYVAVTRAKQEVYLLCARERMLYGRTMANPVSRFVSEIPKELMDETSVERFAPPRSGGYARGGYGSGYRTGTYANPAGSTTPTGSRSYGAPSELSRKVEVPTGTSRTASSFGVVRYPEGTRVSHAVFGAGTILSVRDMGGDFLYEVQFDSGVKKKLMATYAKLKKI